MRHDLEWQTFLKVHAKQLLKKKTFLKVSSRHEIQLPNNWILCEENQLAKAEQTLSLKIEGFSKERGQPFRLPSPRRCGSRVC